MELNPSLSQVGCSFDFYLSVVKQDVDVEEDLGKELLNFLVTFASRVSLS
jgi:hypothetical protein